MNQDFLKVYETKTVDELKQLKKWNNERRECIDYILSQRGEQ